jgi:hypothetical protein
MTKHQKDWGDIWPNWVPDHVKSYILHAKEGKSIRTVARQESCHASTVLRHVRQVEAAREEPLTDEAVNWLISKCGPIGSQMETDKIGNSLPAPPSDDADMAEITRVLPIALRRLAQPKAVLAIAAGMDRAVIVRDREDGEAHRLGVIERPVALALALNGWITCDAPARISRYRVTQAGRAALNSLIAREENRAGGFSEAPGLFDMQARRKRAQTRKSPQADTPVSALARRRDSRGEAFLDAALVRAAERIQDDFELAQMEPRMTANWDDFLTAGISGPGHVPDPALRGSAAARERVSAALRVLGPGLADVVLECCCRLQGLEAAEKKLGWSARSGKIVLRIALQRLTAYYDGLQDGGGLIG